MDEETRALLATMVGGEQECDEMFGNLQQLETGVEQLNNLLDSAPPSALGTENFSSLFVTTAADMRIILFMIANNLEAMRHYDTSQPNPTLVEQAAKLYAPLAHKLGLYQVKTELEDLSLKYSEHDVYYHIAHELNQKKRERDEYIARFVDTIEERLKQTSLKYHIKQRTKSIHSIWQKMQKQHVDVDGVYDLYALRIILDLRTRACRLLAGVQHHHRHVSVEPQAHARLA